MRASAGLRRALCAAAALAVLGLGCSGAKTSGDAGEIGGGYTCDAGCESPFACDEASGLCKNQGVPHLAHFWIIVMENTSFASLNGDTTDAPYLNGLFADGGPGVELAGYRDTGVHPSLPNYIGLVGGDNFGITHDGDARTYTVPASTPDIASQLEGAGMTWHEYSESQTTPCELTDDANGLYVSKHNPMPHFMVTQNATADCQANDVSFEPEGSMPGMAADIAAGQYFSYVFIAPNLCDDGHSYGACLSPLGANAIQQQDWWLSQNVPLILNSSAYKQGGVLMITWDEGENDSDAIMAVLASPLLAHPGSVDSSTYTHYSTLSTVDAAFGLSSLPASHGHHDPPITTVWK